MALKMLYILNIAKKVNNFSEASMMAAKDLGIDFTIVGNWGYSNDEERKKDEIKYGINIYQVDFFRKPYDLRNYRAYKQIINLIQNNKYDIIHCNTPIGGVVGRLAGKKCKVKTIVYQAHGFHFYKEAPIINWLIYYPIEKWLAHYTDCLITINNEDKEIATSKFHLRNEQDNVRFVHGVGVDLLRYASGEISSRNNKRSELGFSKRDIICISAGDLIKRKNYECAIKALKIVDDQKIHLLICGTGPNEDVLKRLSKRLGLEANIHFLGFRTDMIELLQCSDLFLLTSLQEGLPRATMEAMACGLPVVCSNIRGNVDLIQNYRNGILCDPKNPEEFAKAINYFKGSIKSQMEVSKNNKEDIKKFSLDAVRLELYNLYKELIAD